MKDKLSIGQTVGVSRVIRKLDERYISPQGKKKVQWELECQTCGARKTGTTDNINRGRLSSCHCQCSEPDNTSKRAAALTKDGCGAKEVYRDYQRNAGKRGIEFNLTLTEATEMFESDCHYCGNPPTMVKERKTRNYLYNGIDRVDNQKIYSVNTTVPCCKTCNRIKHTLPKEEFIHHIKKIIKHHE